MIDQPIDTLDRNIVNTLQQGFPVSDRPYAEVAERMGITETQLINRLSRLLNEKVLTRFGPMYDAHQLGGAFSLVAVKVPKSRFDKVAEIVNSYPQVAHNYQRAHDFNMWYVLATERPEQIDAINHEIEQRIGLKVFNMPKLDEYYVGLQLKL